MRAPCSAQVHRRAPGPLERHSGNSSSWLGGQEGAEASMVRRLSALFSALRQTTSRVSLSLTCSRLCTISVVTSLHRATSYIGFCHLLPLKILFLRFQLPLGPLFFGKTFCILSLLPAFNLQLIVFPAKLWALHMGSVWDDLS